MSTITWTEHATPSTSGHFNVSDCVWASALGLFVLVGNNTSASGLIYTSPDGVTWTAQTAPEMNTFRGVTWSPALALLCVVSINGTHRIATSPDGITWTMRTAPAVAGWSAVTWASALGLFVAVGSVGVAAWSADGITWTSGTGVPATRGWRGVTWAADIGTFVATSSDVTGATTDKVMTSTDGKAWTGRTHPSGVQSLGGGNTFGGNSNCAWSPTLSLFVAPAKMTTIGLYQPMTSPDGITWTLQTLPTAADISTNFFGGVWDTVGHRFVFGGSAHGGFLSRYQWESSDGVTWTAVQPDPGAVFTSPNGMSSVCAFSSTLNTFVWNMTGDDLLVIGVAASGGLSPTSGVGGGGTPITFTHQ